MGQRPFVAFLVDDDDDDKEIFQMALKKIHLQIDCVTASNGLDALRILKENESLIPDFIFLDLNMPKMNGREVLREFNKIDRLNNSAVYIYTTSSDLRDEHELLSSGVTAFITKPTNIGELTAILLKTFTSLTKTS